MDPFYTRRRRYEAALAELELHELFARMPRPYQEQFWQLKLPAPNVVLEEQGGAAGQPRLGGPTDRALKQLIESNLRKAAIDLETGGRMSVDDMLGVIGGCRIAVRGVNLNENFPDAVVRFVREGGPLLDSFWNTHNENTYFALYFAVQPPVAAHSRLDKRLLGARLDFEHHVGGKPAPRVVISAAAPEVGSARLDGVKRPVYRLVSTGLLGIKPVMWNSSLPSDTGAPAPAAEPLPVYVQSHALLQLRRRANLPAAAPYLESWLAESLSVPRVVGRQRQNLLVEFRLKEARIGYLLVTPLPDMLVVRTFLFLTMDGTPESRLLKRRLRLSRPEADWLGLNELSAFTQTDLRDDPVLRPMLEQCGCGQLLNLDDFGYSPQPRPLGAELRRYLRLAA